MIELRNISKTYPGSSKKANDNISLNADKGEILCITGENGAGKTTLMKILMGLEKQDEGIVKVNGNIGMVHQHFMLFNEYTAAQNIVMGNEPKKWGLFFDNKKANEVSKKIINDNNFSISADSKIADLTVGERQQVEICRILHRNSDIIILDEPTSVLTEIEIESLFKTLKTLVLNGKTIILITHKLNEVKKISDRVAVLKNGSLAGVRDSAKTNENEIAKLMTGEDNFILPSKKKSAERNDSIIEFENVTVKRLGQKRPLLDNVSFSAASGEILGFTGGSGNGLGVIEAVLGGFLHPASGRVLHRGKDISRFNTQMLRKNGLAYVPADRIRVGSAQNATVKENMIVNNKDHDYSDWIKKYNIDIQNLNEKASALSGGNLQKLILARELNSYKDYIVFSEPTWGLDIAASRFIINEIDLLRKKGAAIILISANMDDILNITDRIIVMYRGKIINEK